jgi:hypothetical protein
VHRARRCGASAPPRAPLTRGARAQLQGRLAALEAEAEAQRGRLGALSKAFDAAEARNKTPAQKLQAEPVGVLVTKPGKAPAK